MFRNLIIAVTVAAAVPAVASAQDWGWRHAQDHQEHGAFHDEVDAAHERAHEEGFVSPEEHEGYHRALRELHDEFHDDHPGTRHDGYRLPRGERYGYYSYPSYGYAPSYGYDYAPSYGYSYSPGVTLSFGGLFGW